MTTYGPNYPGTIDVSGAQAQTWTNPNNVKVLDGTTATQTPQGFAANRVMLCTVYGFAIPSTETILGIEFTNTRKRSGGTQGEIHDDLLRLIKGGTPGGTNMFDAMNWPTALTAITYGGPTNLVGQTWLYSDINASNFGVQCRLYADLPSDRVAEIDAWSITVYTDGVTTPKNSLMLTGCGI